MEITCYRDAELRREPRFLPASIYNVARTLLEHNNSKAVFVPIRSMQYLAILDAEEFVFLDSMNKSWIEIAWQNFRPQQRASLDESVPYEAVYYTPSAVETMRRLQNEFGLALQQLARKRIFYGEARVLKFDRCAIDQP